MRKLAVLALSAALVMGTMTGCGCIYSYNQSTVFNYK